MTWKEKINHLFKDADIKELIFKGSSFFSIKVIGIIAGYIFTLFVTRLFGAEVNGFLTMSFSIFLLGTLLPRMGFDINLVKTFSSRPLEEARYVYQKTLVLSLIIAMGLMILGILFQGALSKLLNIPVSYVIYGLVSIPLWVSILINIAVLRGLKEITLTSFFKNLGRFLFALILFLLVYYVLGMKEDIVPGLVHLIGLGVLTLYSFFLIYRRLSRVKSVAADFDLSFYVKDSFPMLFSAGIIILLSWTDTFILGIVKSAEEVGIYNITIKIATMVTFSLHSLDAILGPKIAKSYAEDNFVSMQKNINFAVKINFFFALLTSVGIIVFRKTILGFFGDEFLVGSTVLIVLCVGQFVNAFCGPTGIILQMTGHQKVFRNIVLIAFVINLLLALLLIKPYGFYGAAISNIVGIITWNIMATVIAWRKFRIRIFYYPFK